MDPLTQQADDTKKIKKRSLFLSNLSFICAIIIFVTGYYFLQHLAVKIDQSDRDDLLTRVKTIATIVNSDDVAALTGTSSDLTSPAYIRLKKMLYNIHDINMNTRFVYFMRSNSTNDKLIFLVDSEDPSTANYSPPGQVYEDTSPLEMQNYINDVSFTEGPYSDAWGTWVSGYAPIWSQGKMVGIIGMDVSASKWQKQDYSFQTGLVVISLLGSLSFIIIGIYVRRNTKC